MNSRASPTRVAASENIPNLRPGKSPFWRHIGRMTDPKEPKDKDQFARLMAQVEVLRSRAVQEFTKALPPEKRKQMVDNLRDVLSKLTGRKS